MKHLYCLAFLLCWGIYGVSGQLDSIYLAKMNAGDVALLDNNEAEAIRQFQIAIRRSPNEDSKKEAINSLLISINRFQTKLERRTRVAQVAREQAEQQREKAEHLQKVAERARDSIQVLANLEQKARREAVAAQNLAELQRLEASARFLAFAASQEQDSTFVAQRYAFYARRLEECLTRYFPSIRKSFGDAVFRHSVTRLSFPDTALHIKDFLPGKHPKSILLLSEKVTLKEPQQYLAQYTFDLDTIQHRYALVTAEQLYDIFPHYVSTLTMTKQGNTTVAGTQKGDLLTWSGTGSLPTVRSNTHQGAITHLSFSNDDQLLLSSDQQGNTLCWSLQQEELSQVEPLRAASDRLPVYTARFAGNADRLLTRGASKTIRVWDTENGQEIWQSSLPVYAYEALFLADGDQLITSAATGLVQIHDLTQAGNAASQKVFFGSPVIHMDVAPNTNQVYFSLADGSICISNAEDIADTTRLRFDAPVTSAQFSPGKDSSLLVGLEDGRVLLVSTSKQALFHAKERSLLAVQADLGKNQNAIRKVTFSHDSSYLFALDQAGNLMVSRNPNQEWNRLRIQPPEISTSESRRFFGANQPPTCIE